MRGRSIGVVDGKILPVDWAIWVNVVVKAWNYDMIGCRLQAVVTDYSHVRKSQRNIKYITGVGLVAAYLKWRGWR